jgi:ribosome-binding factor A
MGRIEKVNEMIKRELGSMILMGTIKDPRINFVTILSVDVSKDLQHARVRFSTLSDDPRDIQSAQDGLSSSKGFIRKLIAERIVLRYTPEFQFIYDKGVRYASEIDKTLEEIKQMNEREGKTDE